MWLLNNIRSPEDPKYMFHRDNCNIKQSKIRINAFVWCYSGGNSTLLTRNSVSGPTWMIHYILVHILHIKWNEMWISRINVHSSLMLSTPVLFFDHEYLHNATRPRLKLWIIDSAYSRTTCISIFIDFGIFYWYLELSTGSRVEIFLKSDGLKGPKRMHGAE